MKYYAVKKGRVPGVYTSWDACKQQIDKYSGAVYKSFSDKERAITFVEGVDKQDKVATDCLLAYVDGSYNIKTKEYGYGAVILQGGHVVTKLSGKGNNPSFVTMRNVAGEIKGSLEAMRYAVVNGHKAIIIYYDYEGIEKWAVGDWKANKDGTKLYVDYVNKYRQILDIRFVKVLAHSGDVYNDLADELAKKSIGII